jgi:putative aldouronate transport system substrate-binding protein
VLPDYIAKLKASGIEKVEAEITAQWTEFLKNKQ